MNEGDRHAKPAEGTGARRTNGKLLHDGPHAATAQNDGNTVTLTLATGETYTVEAAGTSGEKFTVSITP